MFFILRTHFRLIARINDEVLYSYFYIKHICICLQPVSNIGKGTVTWPSMIALEKNGDESPWLLSTVCRSPAVLLGRKFTGFDLTMMKLWWYISQLGWCVARRDALSRWPSNVHNSLVLRVRLQIWEMPSKHPR